MIRLLLALFGLALIALLGLASLWLLGQVLSGFGHFLVGMAAVLGGALRFALVAGVLGGLAYVLGGAWARPGR
ncbi:hypothetical protein DKM44_12295 [Deinococcus irradiatisoli]|uniref:Uncharacterized protein n=1 Tax=Deinococcus irradiatisoli TaxID=2202254 RepID=A0A2Z3JFH2_9DEIO|nr:hypothetical protein [Deinococcus irradiatisoli]AWN23913.1 hypothetical protein DKM44_12295 [Deinococcus irradiatisoli]